MTKLTILPKAPTPAPRLADVPAGALVVIDDMLLQKVRNDLATGRGPEVVLRVVLPPRPEDVYDGYLEGDVDVPGAEVRLADMTNFRVPAEVEVRL